MVCPGRVEYEKSEGEIQEVYPFDVETRLRIITGILFNVHPKIMIILLYGQADNGEQSVSNNRLCT